MLRPVSYTHNRPARTIQVGRQLQIDHLVPRIDYTAPRHVRAAVASLGRTEDVKFSPSNRRLAVVGFAKNKITVFEISVTASQNAKGIVLTDMTEISSPFLKSPHGIDFIDDEKILVANRSGQPCIFELPASATGRLELTPLAVIRSAKILTPGSVAVMRKRPSLYEALICNGYGRCVTRHRLELGAACAIKNGDVLLRKWIDFPDGISISKDQEWIAVSIHGSHTVFVYENKPSLNKSSAPVGILRRVDYPHGLRFTSDGRFIVVADAASPHVNIYAKGNSDWRGLSDPLLSFRVLNNDDFLRGRHNPEEGGPKGIDLSDDLNVFVATSECQPLAFFDLRTILEGAHAASNLPRKAAGSLSVGEKTTYTSNYLLRRIWLSKLKALQVRCNLNLWSVKRQFLWVRALTWKRIIRKLIQNRITRLLRRILHPSLFRILCYLTMYRARHVIGVEGAGAQLRLLVVKQNLLPIAKEMPREPINSEEIPRVIFQTWKSRIDVPPNFRYWRSTFIKHNSSFQCILWDDNDNRDFIAEKFAWFLPIYDRLPPGVFRADAVRPFFLFLYGGLYADMDTECLRPWMPHVGDVILGQMGPDLRPADSIPNAIMASKPFQLFWLLVSALMIEKVESFVKDDDLKEPWAGMANWINSSP